MSVNKENKRHIGIVGSGIMGRGIAQLFLRSACRVKLFDANEQANNDAQAFVFAMLQRLVDKGKLGVEELAECQSRLVLCHQLEELHDCEIVIEAIVENLEVKKELFTQLEKIVANTSILASNTSSLLIADIASACQQPERICGLHFFNPVPLMQLVEVIPGHKTAQRHVNRLVDIVSAAGHRAVLAADQAGFLVNHAGRAYYTEALKILEEGIADVVDIDNVMREAMGFRMGPLELLDLTGLDVSGKVMQSIYEQFLQDPWYRPSSLVAPRLAAGLFGRKTKAGFYRYEDKQQLKPEPVAVPTLNLNAVWLNAQATPQLRAFLTSQGVNIVSHPNHEETIILLQFWGNDVSSIASTEGLDPARCVALDPLPDFNKRRTLMLSPVTRADIRDSAHALLASDGVAVTVINDSPGFISQRMMALVVNIGANIVQRRIASVSDLEAAVKLGLGYPHGPLSWGEIIGARRIVEILKNMHRLTQEPRYRSNMWLRRRADLCLSLLQEEAARHDE